MTDTDDISDGFHTFGELYDHRRALTAALVATNKYPAWRSKQHHPDGDPIFPGYFIVGIELPTGTITYHYKLEYWDDFYFGTDDLEHAPVWDGASPAATVERLLAAARREKPPAPQRSLYESSGTHSDEDVQYVWHTSEAVGDAFVRDRLYVRVREVEHPRVAIIMSLPRDFLFRDTEREHRDAYVIRALVKFIPMWKPRMETEPGTELPIVDFDPLRMTAHLVQGTNDFFRR